MQNLIPINKKLRYRARRLALQAMYQWYFTADAVDKIVASLEEGGRDNRGKFDNEYFLDLLTGIIEHIQDIDNNMQPILDRPAQELNPVELAILRVAVYELCYRPDVPYRVVIDQALELAKEFGSQEGHKYVNAVLDKLARKVRALELPA